MPGNQPILDSSGEFGQAADADAANLDYANRATALVLEYLSRGGDRDPELLEKLGWSAEELQQFLARWRRLKGAAREDLAEQRELDESLRSLGLRDPARIVRPGGSRVKTLDGLRQSGVSSQPPIKYRDQFESYRKSRARIGP